MEKRVWYVCYGSNLNRERFMCYIQGGTLKGSKRPAVGCTDKTLPQEDQSMTIPYPLYFSKKSSQWDGSVAFIRTKKDKDSETLGRAYCVTDEQFQEIVEQENGNKKINPINLDEIIKNGSGNIVDVSFYNFIIYLGKIGKIDAFTFTSKVSSNSDDFVGPSKEYFDIITSGIVDTYKYPMVKAEKYLRQAIKRSHNKKIDNLMINYVNDLVKQHWRGYEIKSKEINEEIIEEISLKYGFDPDSIIPSDYCYNRVNNGINPKKKPTLFEYIEHGKYLCWGENYSYNGPVYHHDKASNSEYQWGVCENGVRRKY